MANSCSKGDSYPTRATSDTNKQRLEDSLNAFMEVLIRKSYKSHINGRPNGRAQLVAQAEQAAMERKAERATRQALARLFRGR
jgi:hypothetical protein